MCTKTSCKNWAWCLRWEQWPPGAVPYPVGVGATTKPPTCCLWAASDPVTPATSGTASPTRASPPAGCHLCKPLSDLWNFIRTSQAWTAEHEEHPKRKILQPHRWWGLLIVIHLMRKYNEVSQERYLALSFLIWLDCKMTRPVKWSFFPFFSPYCLFHKSSRMPLSTLSINLSPVPIYFYFLFVFIYSYLFLFIFFFLHDQPVLLLTPAPETSQAAELWPGWASSPRQAQLCPDGSRSAWGQAPHLCKHREALPRTHTQAAGWGRKGRVRDCKIQALSGSLELETLPYPPHGNGESTPASVLISGSRR